MLSSLITLKIGTFCNTKRNKLSSYRVRQFITNHERGLPQRGCPSGSWFSTQDSEIPCTSGPELFSRGLIGLFLVSLCPCMYPKSRMISLWGRGQFGHASLCICSLLFDGWSYRSFDFYQNNNTRIFFSTSLRIWGSNTAVQTTSNRIFHTLRTVVLSTDTLLGWVSQKRL